MLPKGIRQADLNELLRLRELAKAATEDYEVLRDKVMRAYEEDGNHVSGEVLLNLSTARTFQPEAFAQAFPVDKYPLYYKQAVDPEAVPTGIKAEYTKSVRRLQVSRVKRAVRALRAVV